MSSLKLAHAGLQSRLALVDVPQNRAEKSVTRDTSHWPIGPYVVAAAVGSAHHASRATSSAARSAKGYAATGGYDGGGDGQRLPQLP